MWHLHTYEVLQLPVIQGDRSVAIKRDALEAVGGLPTHTYAREDWDLACAWRIRATPSATARGHAW
jgi:hypothetical protein